MLHTAVLVVTDVYRVDAQNHRTHLITYKPYDDEAKRVAVAVADALRQLVAEADDLHEEIADARVRVGIESGIALAVRNGTRGDRELLFLGNPANHAAKLLGGTTVGIYLGAVAPCRARQGVRDQDPDSRGLENARVPFDRVRPQIKEWNYFSPEAQCG